MPTFIPVSPETLGAKRWVRYSSYTFAAKDAVLPLVAAELPKACLSLPIAFIAQGEKFMPVALLGFEQGQNMLIDDSGKWIGPYVPSVLRSHPFKMAKMDNDQFVLCVDQDSGLITDGPDGELFFNAEGGPSKAVQDVMEFLRQVEANNQTTIAMCQVLAKHKIICPWPITVKTSSGDKKIDGLFQVDEQALNSLDDEAFLELRQNGVLPLIYCQLISMQQLPTLNKLAELRTTRKTPAPSSTVKFEDDMIKFS